MDASLRPLSLHPCLKPPSIPAKLRMYCPGAQSEQAATDPLPKQAADPVNMLLTSESLIHVHVSAWEDLIMPQHH